MLQTATITQYLRIETRQELPIGAPPAAVGTTRRRNRERGENQNTMMGEGWVRGAVGSDVIYNVALCGCVRGEQCNQACVLGGTALARHQCPHSSAAGSESWESSEALRESIEDATLAEEE